MSAQISPFGNLGLVRLVTISLIALHASVAFAQNDTSTKGRNDKAVYTAIEKVPTKARAKPNPLENDPNALAAGGKLFEQHCSECHGMKASGTKRGPSLLKEQVRQATPGALFWILSNGVIRHGMPDWSKLPEPERWQIVTFLKSFRAAATSHFNDSTRSNSQLNPTRSRKRLRVSSVSAIWATVDMCCVQCARYTTSAMKISKNDAAFDDALEGLRRGDFSRLDPLFQSKNSSPPRIVDWIEQGDFRGREQELAEALTCACFNGRTEVAEYLLNLGIAPSGGRAQG